MLYVLIFSPPLQSSNRTRTAPAPALPADVIEKTGAKYREALERLTGNQLKD